MELSKLIAEINLRFTSGNSIPVHDARINIDEWRMIEILLEHIKSEPECPSCKGGCGGVEVYYYCPCCVGFLGNAPLHWDRVK